MEPGKLVGDSARDGGMGGGGSSANEGGRSKGSVGVPATEPAQGAAETAHSDGIPQVGRLDAAGAARSDGIPQVGRLDAAGAAQSDGMPQVGRLAAAETSQSDGIPQGRRLDAAEAAQPDGIPQVTRLDAAEAAQSDGIPQVTRLSPTESGSRRRPPIRQRMMRREGRKRQAGSAAGVLTATSPPDSQSTARSQGGFGVSTSLQDEVSGSKPVPERRMWPDFRHQDRPDRPLSRRVLAMLFLIPFTISLLNAMRAPLSTCLLKTMLPTEVNNMNLSFLHRTLYRLSAAKDRGPLFLDPHNTIEEPHFDLQRSRTLSAPMEISRSKEDCEKLPQFLLMSDLDTGVGAHLAENITLGVSSFLIEYNRLVSTALASRIPLVHRPLINLPSSEDADPSDGLEKLLQIGMNELKMSDFAFCHKSFRVVVLPSQPLEATLQIRTDRAAAKEGERIMFVIPPAENKSRGRTVFRNSGSWWREKVLGSKLMQQPVGPDIVTPASINVLIALPEDEAELRYEHGFYIESWSALIDTVLELIQQKDKTTPVRVHFLAQRGSPGESMEEIARRVKGCSGQCTFFHLYPITHDLLVLRNVLAADVLIDARSHVGYLASICSKQISVSVSKQRSYDGAINHIQYDEQNRTLDAKQFLTIWEDRNGGS